MPWTHIELNDGGCVLKTLNYQLNDTTFVGNTIPSIAFGTWKRGNGQGAIDIVEEALSIGYGHIGTHTDICRGQGHL